MTASPTRVMPLGEIPEAMEAEISRGWGIINAAPEGSKETTLQDIAADLFAAADVNRTVHPESDYDVEQTIKEQLLDMAHARCIPVDETDRIITKARRQGRSKKIAPEPRAVNGHTTIEEPPPASDPAEFSGAPPTTETRPKTIVAAKLVTPIDWPQEAPLPVDWLAARRIPRGDVTTLSGDGGAGKTDIAIQLAANVARGAIDWLGHEIAKGPVVLISAEEPEREIRRRLWLHAKRANYAFTDLVHLHQWFPNETGDSILAAPDRRSGIMLPTKLMDKISASIKAIAPVLVVVDNVAATFAGNQNERVMARSYVNLWRAVARGPGSPAVLLLDHPSLSGLTQNTGRGGNMDWRNAVRSALYLKPAEERAEADQGIRILETVKSNYGPFGRSLRLCWNDGGLQLEHAPTAHHKAAKDRECEETFLRLMDERNAQGRHVSDKSGKNYAPSVFAGLDGNSGFTRQVFAKAMDRLFAAKRIALRPIRVDGHTRQCLDRPDLTGRERPVNAKNNTSTSRQHARQRDVNEPSSPSTPARDHPHTPY